ncbi:hypothetical protein F0919_00305 [Taibaiella lutea]|uniref:Virulence factor Evf domain-containing protein n=1 Tax=Taibaiella lutea TaxID=2608001 RepID=A0A5M6CLP9_9BACT|nr:hypothetical protein [Taibaiella lutea]KAA5536148.1 hypothetical protein F0919_00305 [Taibaiella lutea]
MPNPNETPSSSQKETDFENQINEAGSFFNVTSENSVKLLGESLMSEESMAVFIVVTPKNSSDAQREEEIKSYLKSFVSIMAEYINRYYEVKGPQFITDLDSWLRPLNALPLMSRANIEKHEFKRNEPGTEIASQLISLFYKPNSIASEEFKNFLRDRSRRIKDLINRNGSFKMIFVVSSIEIVGNGSEQKHSAKIKLFKTELNKNNSGWIDNCNNSAKIDINVEYSLVISELNIAELRNNDTKKALDRFIQSTRKFDDYNDGNFYEGAY